MLIVGETILVVVLLALGASLVAFAWPIGKFIDGIRNELADELTEAGHKNLAEYYRREWWNYPLTWLFEPLTVSVWTLRIIGLVIIGSAILLSLVFIGVVETG